MLAWSLSFLGICTWSWMSFFAHPSTHEYALSPTLSTVNLMIEDCDVYWGEIRPLQYRYAQCSRQNCVAVSLTDDMRISFNPSSNTLRIEHSKQPVLDEQDGWTAPSKHCVISMHWQQSVNLTLLGNFYTTTRIYAVHQEAEDFTVQTQSNQASLVLDWHGVTLRGSLSATAADARVQLSNFSSMNASISINEGYMDISTAKSTHVIASEPQGRLCLSASCITSQPGGTAVLHNTTSATAASQVFSLSSSSGQIAVNVWAPVINGQYDYEVAGRGKPIEFSTRDLKAMKRSLTDLAQLPPGLLWVQASGVGFLSTNVFLDAVQWYWGGSECTLASCTNNKYVDWSHQDFLFRSP